MPCTIGETIGETDKERRFAQRMKKYMETNVNLTIGDEGHSKIGSMSIKAKILFAQNGDLIGGYIVFEQLGCDMPDGSTCYFSDKEAAHKAGAQLTDVRWSTSGTFNHDLTPAESVRPIEWMGY